MFYTIYKITNSVNGKIYIGSHKTTDINDNYMGSGKYLKYAQNKYGIDNFVKTILFVFDTPELMYKKEAELVNECFLLKENTYNLKIGGFGGFDYINQSGKNLYGNNGKTSNIKDNFDRGRETQKRLKKENPEYSKMISKKISESLMGRVGTMIGKYHTEEAKKAIGEKNSISQKGSKNSQFGSMWITNGVDNRKIQKECIIPEGWKKGRIIKINII